MYANQNLFIAQSFSGKQINLLPNMANRHGLIAGATGTGKTVTLKTMAESFSEMGVPVFLADVKGDLSGFVNPCTGNKHVDKRVLELELDKKGYVAKTFPTQYWDVFGKKGIPIRTTISEMGSLLLSRILNLNQTQTDILSVVFKIADDLQLLLIDTKDLKAVLKYVSENYQEFAGDYGNIAPNSVQTIIRAIVSLEGQGGKEFFGEPSFEIADIIKTEGNNGVINVLDCVDLIQYPAMYGSVMLWLLSELYESMPEVGDCDKPKMVFFFDEAHMLFNGASKSLLEKVTQVVKLIRSKGVGIYFITQSPSDIPDSVLSQLGNKVQHALRAFTPTDQKAVKTAANSFRPNPEFNTAEVISELATGEALVSFLDEKGSPSIVERAYIMPPQSSTSPITDMVKAIAFAQSPLYAKYKDAVDNYSAYEKLAEATEEAQKQYEEAVEQAQMEKEMAQKEKELEKLKKLQEKEEEKLRKLQEKEEEKRQKELEKKAKEYQKQLEKEDKERQKRNEKILKTVGKTATSMIKNKAVKGFLRGVLGILLK